MTADLYVVILNDGSKSYAVAPGEGDATREEAMESVAFWNGLEGWSARLGIVTPED